jgi:hypothetical protein
MSENAINRALRTLGCAGTVMTAHRFRSMASTLCRGGIPMQTRDTLRTNRETKCAPLTMIRSTCPNSIIG